MNAVSAVPTHELHNLSDFGGIETLRGPIRSRRLFRAANPDKLSARGWQDIVNSGVRTVVDLRNDDEVEATPIRPSSISVARRPVEDQSDASFMSEWGNRLNTPAYYPVILERWPGLIADAVSAIADAPDGAVLFHCAGGQDRTGMVSAIVLEVVRANRSAIRDNYAAGVRGNNEWWRINGEPGDAMTDEQLSRRLETILPTLDAFLDGVEIERYLLDSGVSADQLARLRSRLLDG